MISCGSDPKFTEDLSSGQSGSPTTADADGARPSGDAIGAGSVGSASGAGDAGVDGSDDINTASNGGVTGGIAGGIDGDASDASGGVADASDGGSDDPSGGGADDDTYGDDPDETLAEDGGTVTLPGVKVAKVGVNFEDLPNGDFDFNDAVLCFTGAFKVDDSNVVSYKHQRIIATTFSASGCSHRIDVRIVNADGTEKTLSYSSRDQNPIEMDFGFLSRLEVTMTPVDSPECRASTMHDPTYAQVLLDKCNLSGD